MFPDYFFFRWPLIVFFTFFDAVPYIALAYTFLGLLAWPDPALAVLRPARAAEAPKESWAVSIWLGLELLWWIVDSYNRKWLKKTQDSRETFFGVPQEERWPLLKAMTSSDDDAWSIWRGYFNRADSPVMTGIDDPSIGFEPEDVGRDDVAKVLSHYFYNRRPDELSLKDTADVSLMVEHLEAAIRASAGRDPRFRFPSGSRPNVDSMRLYDQPLQIFHRPLVFYVNTILLAQIGNWALAIRGFRHFGAKEPFWPWFWMRGRHPHGTQGFTEDEKQTAKKLSYWYFPGRKARRDSVPFVFFHGMSGSYGPTPFLLALAWITGRPIYLPEYPIVMMRSASVGTIVARRETVAAMRFALRARGYEKCVVIGHSLGTAPAVFLLHDCPEVVQSTILIDPATICLQHADVVRNFFRMKCRTAAEVFFQYFACEKGIGLFMSRYVLWNEAIVFGPRDQIRPEFPPTPHSENGTSTPKSTPMQPPRPPRLDPERTMVYSSENDCICPAKTIGDYCKRQGIPFEMMGGFEHARVLFSPWWMRRIIETGERMGAQADEAIAASIRNAA